MCKLCLSKVIYLQSQENIARPPLRPRDKPNNQLKFYIPRHRLPQKDLPKMASNEKCSNSKYFVENSDSTSDSDYKTDDDELSDTELTQTAKVDAEDIVLSKLTEMIIAEYIPLMCINGSICGEDFAKIVDLFFEEAWAHLDEDDIYEDVEDTINVESRSRKRQFATIAVARIFGDSDMKKEMKEKLAKEDVYIAKCDDHH